MLCVVLNSTRWRNMNEKICSSTRWERAVFHSAFLQTVLDIYGIPKVSSGLLLKTRRVPSEDQAVDNKKRRFTGYAVVSW